MIYIPLPFMYKLNLLRHRQGNKAMKDRKTNCSDWDSNPGPFVEATTALPTEPSRPASYLSRAKLLFLSVTVQTYMSEIITLEGKLLRFLHLANKYNG